MLAALYRPMAWLYRKINYYIYSARIRMLLARGMVIGKNVTISSNTVIDATYPYLIRIGNNVSLAEHVRLLAHDAGAFKFTGGYTRLGAIDIKDNCFIGDRSTILPGVTIGPNALVAAGSVVNRDVPPNSCVAGMPARVYARFDDYIARNREQIEKGPVFSYAELADHVDNLSEAIKQKLREACQNGGSAYVKGYTGRNPYTWNVD